MVSFCRLKGRGGDHYDFDAAYAAMQGYYDQFDVNWLNQETLVNDEFAASGYPDVLHPRRDHRHAV